VGHEQEAAFSGAGGNPNASCQSLTGLYSSRLLAKVLKSFERTTAQRVDLPDTLDQLLRPVRVVGQLRCLMVSPPGRLGAHKWTTLASSSLP